MNLRGKMDVFSELIEYLEIRNENTYFLEDLKQRTATIIYEELPLLIKELEIRERGASYNIHSYDAPVILFLLSHCHHLDSDLIKAEKLMERSAEKFRVSNYELNESLAHFYLALLYSKTGRPNRCRLELDVAAHILVRLEEDYATIGKYDKIEKIRFLFGKIATQMRKASHLAVPVAPKTSEGVRFIQEQYDNFSLSWLPIYPQVVRAGPEGSAWKTDHTDGYAAITLVQIDGRTYFLHLIQKNSSSDRLTVLTYNREYGLVKVVGDSMNNYQPSIESGDYILFYKRPSAQDGDVVVACHKSDQDGDIPYMVKLYKGMMLHSVSTKQYPVIDDKFEILGIVLAVAKAKHEAT